MRHDETVTFSGSGLDRRVQLHRDAQAIGADIAAGRAETVLLWRGKVLMAGDERLARLAMDHRVLASAGAARSARPEENGRLIFAHDISPWQPAGHDEAAPRAFFDTSEQHHPDLPGEMRFVDLRRVMTRLGARDAELAATARALVLWHESHRFCGRCGRESRATQSGWQRCCEGCGAQHFPRTDPVVIMLITDGNRTLLGRSPGWPEGMYSCLAGFVEPGETLEAAVRREVFEEAGVRVGAVAYLASQPWAFPSSLMIGCRGVALDAQIRIDPVEIEDVRWVSREEVMAAFAGQCDWLQPARKGAIAHFLLRNWLADRLD